MSKVTGFKQPLWCLTIALKDGIEDHLPAIKRLLSKFQTGFAVLENHTSGHLHVHAMVYRQVQRANKVTVLCERFLTSNCIEFSRFAIKVKRCTVPSGWLYYLKKSMKTDTFFWVAGFSSTWLINYKTDLKKIPNKMLNGDNYHVSVRRFQVLVLEYASRQNCNIQTKRCVMDVCKAMMRDGYEYGAIYHKLKGLTACLLTSLGSTDADEDLEIAFGISTFIG